MLFVLIYPGFIADICPFFLTVNYVFNFVAFKVYCKTSKTKRQGRMDIKVKGDCIILQKHFTELEMAYLIVWNI